MRRSLLVGVAVVAPLLFASSASACGWGCDCAPSYGYSYGYSAPLYGYSSYYGPAYGYGSSYGYGSYYGPRTDTVVTTVPACASMVHGRTVGAAEWASAEWDGAEDAAGRPTRLRHEQAHTWTSGTPLGAPLVSP